MVRSKTYQFQALEYPLPECIQGELIALGEAAVAARKKIELSRFAMMSTGPDSEYIRPVIQTPEGEDLDRFLLRTRDAIGVFYTRDWMGPGSPTK